MDPIAGAAINSASQLSQAGVASSTSGVNSVGVAPQQADVDSFNVAMNTPINEVNSTQSSQSIQANQQTQATDFNNTQAQYPSSPSSVEGMPSIPTNKIPGDNILDNLSHSMRSTQEGAIQMASNMGGEMGDMMRLQMEVAKTTFNQTMVGQVGSKTGQGAQQLLKGQ